MGFVKLIRLISFLLIISSCKTQIRPFSIEQNDICNYFYLKIDTIFIEGEKRFSLSPEIQNSMKDSKAYFFKKYPKRFNFLLTKEIASFHDTSKIVNKNVAFCKSLQNGRFYNNLKLLIPTDTPKTKFTKDEMMLVASRFFYCDTVLRKGNKMGVGSHICVGINGLHELNNNRDLTPLEAFCFEAINSSLLKRIKPVFYKKFVFYVAETNKKEKPSYINDKTHLEKVREHCYKLMQSDMALQETLLDYFEKKKRTFGFSIE